MYQTTRWIRSRLRAPASSRSALRSRDACPRSVVTNPGAPLVLPADAGHDSSVSHTGLRPSRWLRITRRASSTSLITLRGFPV